MCYWDNSYQQFRISIIINYHNWLYLRPARTNCIEATSLSYNYKQTADVAFSLDIKQKFFNLASSELQFLKIGLMNFRFLKNLWGRQGHLGNFYSYLGFKSCKFLCQNMFQNTLIISDWYVYNSTLMISVLYKYSKAGRNYTMILKNVFQLLKLLTVILNVKTQSGSFNNWGQGRNNIHLCRVSNLTSFL